MSGVKQKEYLLEEYILEQMKMIHLKELLVEVCADYSALVATNKKLRQQSGD